MDKLFNSFVTNILALFLRYLLKAFLNILFPTLLSIEDKGSSNRYKSASLYKHLAKDILAFCPPLTLALVLFISVLSPFANSNISFSNSHTETTCLYFSSLYSLLKIILFFTVSVITHGC